MAALLKLNERDNVRIALQKIPAGSEAEGLLILDEIIFSSGQTNMCC